jgi:tetratricopeptide (TPR) repeat protein
MENLQRVARAPKIFGRSKVPAFSSPAWAVAIVFLISQSLARQAAGQSTSAAVPPPGSPSVIEWEGTAEVSRRGSPAWDPAYTNQVLFAGDQFRTGERSRATIRLSPLSLLRLGSLSHVVVPDPTRPPATRGRIQLNLLRGLYYFLHRDRPGEFEIKTKTVATIVRGTEFNVRVYEDGTTRVSLVDGAVEMSNEFGTLNLSSGEEGLAEPGRPPVRTAKIEAVNDLIQWALYYPGVLDLAELELDPAATATLAESLAAYRSGDLLAALAKYPPGRQPGSNEEKVYLAALLLSVGLVEEALVLAGPLASECGDETEVSANTLALALQQVVAAVKQKEWKRRGPERSATAWLAESYSAQARAALDEALRAARKAVALSPDFGFGWARVAELEFSFGRTDAALAALDKALEFSPRNAQALALKGFLLSAQNRIARAIEFFDQAIAVDGALGNAWLGRGLCRIRRGEREAGLADLQVAATVEPQRAVLRSYLGKAYSDRRDAPRAEKELNLARQFDPGDPTSWLYSALLNERRNRINEAVRDLERSQELNDNRSVYRSALLLDQDRAVRSANLARIYQDAGMTEVASREAARAVNADYGNYSGHLFLANTFNVQLEAQQNNFRFETAAQSSYLVANLLAPVGGGTLSPTLSQQEYSRLFERNRLGVVSVTDYTGNGDWRQAGAVHGNHGGTSYAVEAVHRSFNGQRVNNDLEQTLLSAKLNQQLTTADNLFFEIQTLDASSGDTFQYYDKNSANPGVRYEEKQEPIVTAGWHHQWAPGSHTLLLATVLNDRVTADNPQSPALVVFKPFGPITAINGITLRQAYSGELEIYGAELQQIWQTPRHTTIAGGRFQYGNFENRNRQDLPSSLAAVFPDPPEPAIDQKVESLYRRFSLYAYHYWRALDSLQLIAGLTFDDLTYPENFRLAPLASGTESESRLSPKAGVIWTPTSAATVRFGYSRSLSGASLEQSFQIEPVQVAGFLQSYRSLIPDSVVGAAAGARQETFDLSLEYTLPTDTYLGLSGQLLNSKLDRSVGTYDVLPALFDFAIASSLREQLDFRERSLAVHINQLVGRDWSFGARYRISEARLQSEFPGVPAGIFLNNFSPSQEIEGLLQQVNLYAAINHRSGFFARIEGNWYHQHNSGYTPARPSEDFWQLNALVGWRFLHRKAELSAGLLNLTDQDYRLSPVNLHSELPRDRTFAMRLRLNL